jgi:hypothetical protein
MGVEVEQPLSLGSRDSCSPHTQTHTHAIPFPIPQVRAAHPQWPAHLCESRCKKTRSKASVKRCWIARCLDTRQIWALLLHSMLVTKSKLRQNGVRRSWRIPGSAVCHTEIALDNRLFWMPFSVSHPLATRNTQGALVPVISKRTRAEFQTLPSVQTL